MKSAIPIPIPQRVSPGELITSSWANQVRDSIQRLTNRKQPDSPNNSSGGKFQHMWQVTRASQVDGVYTYNIRGGTVVIQGEAVKVEEVLALPGGEVTEEGDNGYIFLRVFREESSRSYNPSVPPVIEWGTALVDIHSDYYSECTVLAEVDYGVITQCRNDEICSQELLIVSNGEFALIPVQANSRNTYDPPPV